MARIPGLRRDFRFPWRNRQQIDRDIEDELELHLELRARELEDGGLAPDEARREAERSFGDLARARFSLASVDRSSERRYRVRTFLEELGQDIRYALRTLGSSGGFTVVAVLVLALGIGANTAVFSIVNQLLLRPRQVEQPDRLVGVYGQSTEDPTEYDGFSYPTYVDLRKRSTDSIRLAAHTITMVGVAEGEVTRRVIAGLVSSNFFATIGVPLAGGRAFTPEEEHPQSAQPVVVVSHAFWEKRGADPDFVGATLQINGRPFTVIGITSQGFSGTTVLFSPDLWLPLGVHDAMAVDLGGGREGELLDRRSRVLMLFGRLRSGIDSGLAQEELRRLAAQLEEEYPVAQEHQGVRVAPLSRLSMSTNPDAGELSGAMTAPSLLIMGMAGVVLLIACLNLANMLLARGMARRTEMAVRISLGGGRGRLLRQLLTEGLVLALLGGVAGLVLAYWAARLLIASLVNLMPYGNVVWPLAPDVRVLVATLAFCVAATLFFAFGPAIKLTRDEVLGDLKEKGGADGERKRRLVGSPRNLLVVGQIALSLVLLTAGGLFLRAAQAAGKADPGFSLDERVLVELDPSLVGYDEARSREMYQHLVERLRSLPGVKSVTQASIVPFGPVSVSREVRLPTDGEEVDRDHAGVDPYYYRIGTDYFRTLGLPFLRGRDFTSLEARGPSDPATSEGGTAAGLAIIDEPLASRLFGDEDPVGRQIRLPGGAPERPDTFLEVVGVVPGTRHEIFDHEPVPHLYVPFGQDYGPNGHLYLHLRGGGEAAAIAMLTTVRDEIRAYDENLPVLTLKTLRQYRDSSAMIWAVEAGAKVFGLFGGLALLLAMVGVYGVKAFVVSRRTRELGIRTALGARPRDLVWMVVREGLALTGVGVAIGLLLSLAVGRLLGSLLYEVSANDPLVLASAPLLLIAAALLAAYLPARRATRVPPTVALRYE